mmetsp:Transcript_1965/g.4713  ORF Transcript_1965/g.4713 Transcript_1965/m.4713 type:complete len:122 (+) Transcript_1965:1687-2052(+)
MVKEEVCPSPCKAGLRCHGKLPSALPSRWPHPQIYSCSGIASPVVDLSPALVSKAPELESLLETQDGSDVDLESFPVCLLVGSRAFQKEQAAPHANQCEQLLHSAASGRCCSRTATHLEGS